jgi:putative SOS response-associated peptidase YedK
MQKGTLICNTFLMCGRYRLSRRKQVVEEYFDTASVECEWNPRYNIAPTQSVPIVRQNPKEPLREMSLVRWGLIPSWARDSSVAAKMINARSETASMKPAFRDALKYRRCLIPADGFYEWSRHEAAWVIVRRAHSTGPAIPLAVLCEVWRFGNDSSRSPRTMYPTVARRVSKPRGDDISASIEADRG